MSGFRELAAVVLSMCLFLILNGKVNGNEKDPEFSRVVVKEGSVAILPCSLSTIQFKVFDWKKDGQKEVFLYSERDEYNNGRSGQDVQFKERVSHFPDQLKNGNASIKIQNTKVADSGNYTCVFPRLQTFLIELVVVGEFTIKDRSAEIDGAASKPYVKTVKTKDGMKLQCKVLGVSPKPKVEWKDSSGNIVPAEEPKITDRGDKYDVILEAPVTKTDNFHCIVTQKEISHQTENDIDVTHEKPETCIQGAPTGWIVAAVLGTLLVLLLVSVVGGVLYVKRAYDITPKKSHQRHENGYEMPPVVGNEQGNGLHTETLLPGSDVPAQTSPV